jgi:hypothetical protein
MDTLVDKVVARYRASSGGLVTYPEGHVPAIVVPRGGSSCATCKALSKDRLHCTSPHFVVWRKSLGAENPTLLPAPADSFCSDWYTSID